MTYRTESRDGRAAADADSLRRIAAVLGVPIAALFTPEPAAEVGGPTPEEVTTLLQAFCAVTSPQARRRCIAAVVAAAAERSGGDGPAPG